MNDLDLYFAEPALKCKFPCPDISNGPTDRAPKHEARSQYDKAPLAVKLSLEHVPVQVYRDIINLRDSRYTL